MKKRFKLENLDCANCAARIEERVQAIPSVEEASVSFMLQRLTVVAPGERMEAVVSEIRRVVEEVEPDCELVD